MKYLIYVIYDYFTKKQLKYLIFFSKAERWHFDEMKKFQIEKTKAICKTHRISINSWDDFYKLPILTKQDLPQKPSIKVDYFEHSTSGSTGEPRLIQVPKSTWSRKDAVFVRSWRRLGVSKKDKVLRLIAGEPEYKFYDYLRNVFPMNYRTIGRKHLDFLIKVKPKLIHGPGGAIRQLIELAVRNGYESNIKGIIVEWCSESSEGHKERLEELGVNFHMQYGLAELATVGSPDGLGNVRVVEETGVIEILNDDNSICKEGEIGNIVVTDFNNTLLPIIRYKTGDKGSTRTISTILGKYRVLENIKGRRVDYYFGPEVKRDIGWWVVSPISKMLGSKISKWRVEIQPSQSKFILHYVPKTVANIDFSSYEKWVFDNVGLNNFNVECHNNGEEFKRKLVEIV